MPSTIAEPSVNIPLTEVQQVLGIKSLQTIYSMIRRGIIPSVHVGRNVRVRRSDFDAWLAAGGSKGVAA